jgi:hypothetical protein
MRKRRLRHGRPARAQGVVGEHFRALIQCFSLIVTKLNCGAARRNYDHVTWKLVSCCNAQTTKYAAILSQMRLLMTKRCSTRAPEACRCAVHAFWEAQIMTLVKLWERHPEIMIMTPGN